ncbi:hypothetical protein BDF20DRAFT_26765 [Mycotypha africana]|uniref:uncharacterized protein n=1 Tax=Mycotypha africana TaxID=64632 RepID=UPI0023017130|nr:uncharacterized protein BDF20DRAFT_26765 [Mycotypha africana]KAI8991152.1 hypothetical protein BDF20DRAFT_26765 [Mycotypha africana]
MVTFSLTALFLPLSLARLFPLYFLFLLALFLNDTYSLTLLKFLCLIFSYFLFPSLLLIYSYLDIMFKSLISNKPTTSLLPQQQHQKLPLRRSFLKSKTNPFIPSLFSLRMFVTIPPSVSVKTASKENGIALTERAINQLKLIQQRENDTDQMLRVLVDSGGCHGYQNKMELTKAIEEDDNIFEKDGVKVIVDNISLQFLKGSTVDYVQELIGSTFQVVENPNAKHSCGCNISYDIDLDKIM